MKAANMTLEGTVVRLEGEPTIGQQKATIRVDRYFNRNGFAVTHVDGYGNGALCLTELTLGQHGIFFVEFTDSGYRAFYLTQFDAFAPATPENVAEAIAAAGGEPFAPESTTRAVTPGLAKSQMLGGAAAMNRGEGEPSARLAQSLAGFTAVLAGLGAVTASARIRTSRRAIR